VSEFVSRPPGAASMKSGSIAALCLAFLAGMLVALFAARFFPGRDASDASRAAIDSDIAAPQAGTGGVQRAAGDTSAEAADSELLELRSALEIEHVMRERLTQEVKRLESLLAERGEAVPRATTGAAAPPDVPAEDARSAAGSSDPTAH